MAARRGSIRFKAQRLARRPLQRRATLVLLRAAERTAAIGGRVLLAAALIFAAGTAGAQIWRIGAENVRLHKQILAVESHNRSLESQSLVLTRRIQLLHDPEYLVPLIHEQLGLARPHEVFIQVQFPSAAGSPSNHD